MTLSTKIEVFTDFTFVRSGLHTCTAVARSLCVSWAFLYVQRRPDDSEKHSTHHSPGHIFSINFGRCIDLISYKIRTFMYLIAQQMKHLKI